MNEELERGAHGEELSRRVIEALYAIGVFILILGSFLIVVWLIREFGPIGGLFLTPLFVISLYALFKGLTLRVEEVVDRWGVLIEGAQGRSEEVFKDVERLIRESDVPMIRVERMLVAPSFVKEIMGVRRDFLIVTNESNPKLKPYKIFINVRDYGNTLDVAWYLTYKLSFLQSLLYSEKLVEPALDVFEEQDLRAYTTLVHHSLMKAVENLMLSMGKDFSKVDRKSKGFLGVS